MTDQPIISQKTTQSIKFGYKTKAGAIKEFFESIPDFADVQVTSHKGDAREPSESTIQATWDPRTTQ